MYSIIDICSLSQTVFIEPSLPWNLPIGTLGKVILYVSVGFKLSIFGCKVIYLHHRTFIKL